MRWSQIAAEYLTSFPFIRVTAAHESALVNVLDWGRTVVVQFLGFESSRISGSLGQMLGSMEAARFDAIQPSGRISEKTDQVLIFQAVEKTHPTSTVRTTASLVTVCGDYVYPSSLATSCVHSHVGSLYLWWRLCGTRPPLSTCKSFHSSPLVTDLVIRHLDSFISEAKQRSSQICSSLPLKKSPIGKPLTEMRSWHNSITATPKKSLAFHRGRRSM
ncbi:hypothetical protein EDD22DRAFT_843450 [Suillus occidentalis]|nr:hypothetical protein EDD22DRAFT_843450 [Suillus occidentalis]